MISKENTKSTLQHVNHDWLWKSSHSLYDSNVHFYVMEFLRSGSLESEPTKAGFMYNDFLQECSQVKLASVWWEQSRLGKVETNRCGSAWFHRTRCGLNGIPQLPHLDAKGVAFVSTYSQRCASAPVVTRAWGQKTHTVYCMDTGRFCRKKGWFVSCRLLNPFVENPASFISFSFHLTHTAWLSRLSIPWNSLKCWCNFLFVQMFFQCRQHTVPR